MTSQASRRRAVLVFANNAKTDLARRALPTALLPLFAGPEVNELSADVHVFSRGAQTGGGHNLHRQVGGSFAARFENAVRAVENMGYDEIVAIGRDCPMLVANDLEIAFAQLRDKRLVLGPDHRGGCYLIAFHGTDAALLRGIRWNRNTDCAQLRARCQPTDVSLLEVKHDLDSWADLRLVARADERIARLAASLLSSLSTAVRPLSSFVDAASRFIRIHGQMPPPLRAA